MKKIMLPLLLFNLISVSSVYSQFSDCKDIWNNLKEYQTGISYNFYCSNPNCYSDSLKNKLLSILKNEFTEQELNEYVKYKSGKNWLEYIETRSRNMAGEDSSRYEKVKDSLINREIEYWKSVAQNRRIDNALMRYIGVLDIKEAIPILHQALENPKQYDSTMVKLVLARLGDSIYYPLVLKQLSEPLDTTDLDIREKIKQLNELIYIGTQESLYQYARFLKVDYGKQIRYIYFHIGYDVLTKLSKVIENKEYTTYVKKRTLKNLKEEWIYFPTIYEKEEVDYKAIHYTLEWMEKNKGKYEFNRWYY